MGRAVRVQGSISASPSSPRSTRRTWKCSRPWCVCVCVCASLLMTCAALASSSGFTAGGLSYCREERRVALARGLVRVLDVQVFAEARCSRRLFRSCCVLKALSGQKVGARGLANTSNSCGASVPIRSHGRLDAAASQHIASAGPGSGSTIHHRL